MTGDRRDSVAGAGWEYLHVAIDDHSRIAFSAVLPGEKQTSVLIFLRQAAAYYQRLGIQFRAVLTDNRSAYRSNAFAAECRRLGLKHRCTRPYTPRTNGEAERFIQTALHGMSVREELRQLRKTQGLAPRLDSPVQLASSACYVSACLRRSAAQVLTGTTC